MGQPCWGATTGELCLQSPLLGSLDDPAHATGLVVDDRSWTSALEFMTKGPWRTIGASSGSPPSGMASAPPVARELDTIAGHDRPDAAPDFC